MDSEPRRNEQDALMQDDVEITLGTSVPTLSSGDDTSLSTSKASELRKLGAKEYKYRDVIRNRDQRRALKGQSCFRCENVSQSTNLV